MADEDKLPRLSYELIKRLDQDVPVPPWPTSAKACANFDEKAQRTLVFLAGQRYMVDVLIGLMNEETREETDEGVSDGPPPRFARVLSADGNVHSAPVADIGDLDL